MLAILVFTSKSAMVVGYIKSKCPPKAKGIIPDDAAKCKLRSFLFPFPTRLCNAAQNKAILDAVKTQTLDKCGARL